MAQIKARVRSWNLNKGFGIIVGEQPSERWFLHITEIKSGATPPAVGSIVYFDAAPPRKPGADQAPRATNATVVALVEPTPPDPQVAPPAVGEGGGK